MPQVKFYRNRARGEAERPRAPYVPQHELMGIEPMQMDFTDRQPGSKVSPTQNPPLRPVRLQNQPYATPVNSPIGTNPVPNVGNNMEHSWSALDGEIIDDLPEHLKSGHQMIDNNEFVTDQALNSEPTFGGAPRNRPFAMHQLTETDSGDRPTLTDLPAFQVSSDLFPVLKEMEEDNYLLLVRGEPICSGPHREVEEAAGALILGTHAMGDGSPVPETDILVLKKVRVNVGVFLG